MNKKVGSYISLVDAIQDLKRKGYTEDFELTPHCIEYPALSLQLYPEKFKVDEFHRFEGMSNPDDNSILFAISSDEGIKGTLVDAYGMYSENLNDAMIERLTMKK